MPAVKLIDVVCMWFYLPALGLVLLTVYLSVIDTLILCDD